MICGEGQRVTSEGPGSDSRAHKTKWRSGRTDRPRSCREILREGPSPATWGDGGDHCRRRDRPQRVLRQNLEVRRIGETGGETFRGRIAWRRTSCIGDASNALKRMIINFERFIISRETAPFRGGFFANNFQFHKRSGYKEQNKTTGRSKHPKFEWRQLRSKTACQMQVSSK